MLRILFVLNILILTANQIQAQDSSQVFTMKDFFAVILTNHPVAKQAGLLNEQAKMQLRIARGELDPYLGSTYDRKEFNTKDYYTLWDSYLKIPTWYGIEFKAGFENNNGQYLNPENNTPSNGLTYLGLSVPIGQGLLIDERRSQIRQAQQFEIIAEAEKIKILNKLILQAAKDYWDWMYYYNKQKLYREARNLANTRYKAVQERAINGDMAAIDTVEAMMQVQSFEILLAQSEVEFKNSTLVLSNYLWNENGVPVEASESLSPSEEGSELSPLSTDSLNQLVSQAKINHPELVKLNAKLSQLAIEKRYISDQFKPKINLNYNVLQTGFSAKEDIFAGSYLSNNYKIGASFSYPLFLRKERGKFQLTKLKITEANLSLQQTNREIENSIQTAANDWMAFEQQISFQEKLVDNSDKLRLGEIERFQNGESSIFLVNSRENYLISSKIKLYEMKAKYAKSKIILRWAAGNMF